MNGGNQMKVENLILLVIGVWVVLASLIAKGNLEMYITLLLIGLLVVSEVSGFFLSSEIRDSLIPYIYFGLFIFTIIVIKRVIQILG